MSSIDLRELNSATITAQLATLHDLSRADLGAGPICVDLALSSPPERAAGALLAQAMLAGGEGVEFVVRLPAAGPLLGSLVRSGIASALASRGEAVHFDPPLPPLGAPDFESLWSTWTPGARQAMAPLFHGHEKAGGLFGPSHAVFVNPHLTSQPGEQASITRLLRRWLTQSVLPDLPEAARRGAVELPAFAVDQLVRNISEHALTAAFPSIDSMVQVEVSQAHALDERSLQLTVLDTGAGVATTLWPKVNPAEHADERGLLGALLAGEIPGWGRGRGFGLATLAREIASRPGASLDLWSGATHLRVAEQIEVEGSELEISGTVLTVSFPLPAL
jgi:hypothetical protein